MANKKVFTNLTFEGNSELINPKLHPTAGSSPPASTGVGQVYFDTGSGGVLNVQYSAAASGPTWRPLHTADIPFSTDALFTSTRAIGNPPFAITSTDLVTNLNADLLDGKHISESALTGAIPVYDSGAALLVGAPTEDGHATPRSYVDNAIQGLDHKESARFTTTDQINLTGLSSQSDLDGTPIAGDRILVKDQDVTTQNGIYIASASGWTRATDTDGLATELVLGGSFSATADITDGTPDNWRSTSSAVLTSAGSGVSGNCLRVQTASGNDGTAYQDITTVIGKAYRISLYMNKGTSGTVAYYVGTGSGADAYSIIGFGGGSLSTDSTASGWVLHENVFKATATTTRISLVSRDSASTDYSEFDSVSLREADLTEGAFVFVEEGTSSANSSWVLSDLATSAWTQFSGAGQLTVNSNGAVAAPLTKSGDTIDFRYSLDNALSTTSAVSTVVNGTFASNITGWAETAGTVSHDTGGDGGRIKVEGTSSGVGRSQNDVVIATIIGKQYTFSVNATGSTGYHFVHLGTTAGDANIKANLSLSGASGTYTHSFTATATTFWIQLGSSNSSVNYYDDVSLVESSALTVKSGGIDTVHLADDAVEPAKLLETGTFQMGMLGLGTAPSEKLHISNGDIRIDSGRGIRVGGAATERITLHTSNGLQFYTNTIERLRIANNGKVGIGADATSPSGTLHVSSGRYGSEKVANGTMEANSNWADLGTINTNERSTTQKYAGTYSRKLVGVGSGDGIQSDTFSVTAGRKYYVECWAYVTAGSLLVRMQNGDGNNVGSSGGLGATSTWTKISLTHTPTVTGSACYFKFYQNGSTVVTAYVDAVTIREDNLAAGVHAYGNDLVVSGNDNTGISIIGQAGATSNLYFGDGLQKDFARITSTRAISGGDANLFLQVSDGGAAATTAMTLFGADKSVKIEGGLGIGADAGTQALNISKAVNNSWLSTFTQTGTTNPYGVQIVAQTNTITAFAVYSESATFKVQNSHSYFTGNVAIGATSSSERLKVVGASTDDPLHLQGNGPSGIKFTNNGTNFVSYIRTYESGTLADNYMGFGVSTGNNTTSKEALRLTGEGLLNQQGNATVNSSTVQGLQDGAAYTLDGTDDKIEVDALATALAGTTTGTIRWRGKFNTLSDARIWMFGDTNANEFIRFRAQSGSSKLIADCRDAGTNKWTFTTTSDFSVGRIYDLVMVQNGTTPVLYVDGVEETLTFSVTTDKTAWFEECAGIDNFRLGCSAYASESDSAFLACTVLQFQAFPSALTAPDVRKLYSGENPKKNLNVELVTNGGFASDTSGWSFTDASGASAAGGQSGNCLVLTHSGSGGDNASQAPTLVVGRYYKITGYVKSGTSGATAFMLGAKTSNGATWIEDVQGTSSGSWVQYSVIFKATETNNLVYLRKNSAAAGTMLFDSISCQEVGTLVDFNPRSASTTKWYNAAIPSLYNGTLAGGVTLSAGSTDHKTNGTFSVEAATTSPLFSIRNNTNNAFSAVNAYDDAGTHKYASGYANSGASAFGGQAYISSGPSTDLVLGTAWGEKLSIAASTGDVKVTNKLGVGTVPTVPLQVKGAVTALGDSRYNVRIEDSTAIAAGVGGGIVFSGAYNGTTQTNFAAIWGEKENATPGNSSGQLHLGARLNTSGISSALVIASDNTVKINTASANAEGFEVTHKGGYGGIRATASSVPRIQLKRSGSTVTNGNIEWLDSNNAVDWDIRVNYEGGGDNFAIRELSSTTVPRLYIKAGDIGISTQTPQGRLDVKGSIRGEADSYTKLLIHSDTTDGSTTFVDSSPSGHAITAVADTKHKTAQYKFGATSMYFDGTGDYLSAPDHDDINNFGTGSYTIDFWFKTSSTQQYTSFYSTEGTSSGFTLLINIGNATDGKIAYWGGMGSDVRTSSGGFNDNNWHHVAFVRSGTAASIYVDGVSLVTATSSAAETGSSNIFRIGNSYFGNRDLTGYMDEFRISKGVARWTSDFTPPARPYSTVNDEFFNEYDDIENRTSKLASGLNGTLIFTGNGGNDSAYISGAFPNTINSGYNNTSDTHGTWLNYLGYNNGATKFRNLLIGDGKTNTLFSVTGSTGDTKVYGKLGVGRIAAVEPLEVQGNIKLIGGTNQRLKICNDDNDNWAEIGNDGASAQNTLEFFTGSSATPSMSILNDGKVLVGGATALGPFGEWGWTPLLQQLGTQGIVSVRASGDVYGGAIHLASARGSNASPTIILDNDRVGGVYFHAHDGGDFSTTPGAIECFIDGTPGVNDTPGRLGFFTASDGSHSITERLRISSDGTQNHYANRIVNSQTVSDLHRTAEPSLRFDGTNIAVDDSVISTTGGVTGDLPRTMMGWIKYKSGGSQPDPIPFSFGSGGSANQTFAIGLNTNGTQAYLYGMTGGNDESFNISENVMDGKWHHVAVTYTPEAGSDLPNIKVYANGVLAVDHDRSTGEAYATSAGYVIGDWSGNNRPWNGEIKSVSYHNRALADTEVAASYNGESTPFKYASVAGAGGQPGVNNLTHTDWVGASATYAGDYWVTHSGADYSVASSGGHNDMPILTIIAASTGANPYTYTYPNQNSSGTTPDETLIPGKKYRASIWVKSGTVNSSCYLNVYTAAWGAHAESQPANVTSTSSWQEIVKVFTATGGGKDGIFLIKSLLTVTGSTQLWSDPKIVPLGEVAAYTPRGISNNKWYNETKLNGTDATSNHGSVSGATVVGQQRFGNTYSFGDIFTVKGTIRLGADAGGVAIWSDGNDGYIKGLDALGNSYNNLYLGGQANALKISHHATTPAVEATSATSGNLIQVARVVPGVLTFDDTTASIAFRITHNLGTAKPIVQVWETSGNRGMVETEVRIGDWTNSADAAALTTLQSSTLTNYVTVVFSSHQGDLTTFDYCVTG